MNRLVPVAASFALHVRDKHASYSERNVGLEHRQTTSL